MCLQANKHSSLIFLYLARQKKWSEINGNVQTTADSRLTIVNDVIAVNATLVWAPF